MLTVACVQVGNYEGAGAAYVNRLARSVSRHLTLPHRFECFTDDATRLDPGIVATPLPIQGVGGWWNKLQLFLEGVFGRSDRVLYLDLDTLVCGSLDAIAGYTGEFAVLQDFNRPRGYGSGVMAWRGGFGAHIWDGWNLAGRPDIAGGDQVWIERSEDNADRLQDLFPGQIVSYKAHRCAASLPAGARVVCLHGRPKFRDMPPDGWARQLWEAA